MKPKFTYTIEAKVSETIEADDEQTANDMFKATHPSIDEFEITDIDPNEPEE